MKKLSNLWLTLCLTLFAPLAFATEPGNVDVTDAVAELEAGYGAIAEIGGVLLVMAAIGAVFGWVLARVV